MMQAIGARANPPSPAAQTIAPFVKGGWKSTSIGTAFGDEDRNDTVLFAPITDWKDTVLFATITDRKGAALLAPFAKRMLLAPFAKRMLLAPFAKGGRHRAAMTGGFALRTPLASSAI